MFPHYLMCSFHHPIILSFLPSLFFSSFISCPSPLLPLYAFFSVLHQLVIICPVLPLASPLFSSQSLTFLFTSPFCRLRHFSASFPYLTSHSSPHPEASLFLCPPGATLVLYSSCNTKRYDFTHFRILIATSLSPVAPKSC